jgi:hypothetical protein
LPGALDALSHGERIARERGMPRLGRLMQIEPLRALTLSDELVAGRAIMAGIGPSPEKRSREETDAWALRQGSTFVAMAHRQVRAAGAAGARLHRPGRGLRDRRRAAFRRWPGCGRSLPPRRETSARAARRPAASRAQSACSAGRRSGASSSTRDRRCASSCRRR